MESVWIINAYLQVNPSLLYKPCLLAPASLARGNSIVTNDWHFGPVPLGMVWAIEKGSPDQYTSRHNARNSSTQGHLFSPDRTGTRVWGGYRGATSFMQMANILFVDVSDRCMRIALSHGGEPFPIVEKADDSRGGEERMQRLRSRGRAERRGMILNAHAELSIGWGPGNRGAVVQLGH